MTRRRKPRTTLPDDFTPTNETRATLNQEGHADADIDCELARFRDSAIANGRLYANWQAAFRNWFRSPYYRPNGGPPAPKSDLENVLIGGQKFIEGREGQ